MLKKIYWNFFRRNIFGITGPLRVLPDFIIIGSMKCGTTSLYYDICEHPCVSPAAYDEIGFFDSNFHLGLNWYRSMFPTKRRIEDIRRKEGVAITGEDTPFYFWNPVAAKRIQKLLPNIKLITILRNPIDRAYSEYQDVVSSESNSPSFETFIENEINTRRKDSSLITEENFEIFNQKNSYLLKGIYVDQLKIWAGLFPKEQIFTLSTENLNSEPITALESVFQYLNLPDYKIKNTRRQKQKKYVPMNSQTRKILIEFFKPHNERLFKFIGKKFDWDE
jgi:hypothetical protein